MMDVLMRFTWSTGCLRGEKVSCKVKVVSLVQEFSVFLQNGTVLHYKHSLVEQVERVGFS